MAYGGPWTHIPGQSDDEDKTDQKKDEPRSKSDDCKPAVSKPEFRNQTMRASTEEEFKNLDEYRRCMAMGKIKSKQGSNTEAIPVFEKALQCQVNVVGEDHLNLADTKKIIGKLHLTVGHHREAREMLLQVVSLYEKHDVEPREVWECHDFLAQCCNGLNDKYTETAHYNEAIRLLNLARTGKTPVERLAHLHNNLANAYKKLDEQQNTKSNLKLVRKHLEKAKEVMTQLKRDGSKNMVKILLSLGDVYKELDLKEQAIAELEASIEVSNKTHPGSKEENRRKAARHKLVTLYESMGENEKAEEHKNVLKRFQKKPGTKNTPSTSSGALPEGEQDLTTMVPGPDPSNIPSGIDHSLTTADMKPIEPVSSDDKKPGVSPDAKAAKTSHSTVTSSRNTVKNLNSDSQNRHRESGPSSLVSSKEPLSTVPEFVTADDGEVDGDFQTASEQSLSQRRDTDSYNEAPSGFISPTSSGDYQYGTFSSRLSFAPLTANPPTRNASRRSGDISIVPVASATSALTREPNQIDDDESSYFAGSAVSSASGGQSALSGHQMAPDIRSPRGELSDSIQSRMPSSARNGGEHPSTPSILVQMPDDSSTHTGRTASISHDGLGDTAGTRPRVVIPARLSADQILARVTSVQEVPDILRCLGYRFESIYDLMLEAADRVERSIPPGD